MGAVNHPKYDTVQVDGEGKLIIDSSGNYIGGAQQKTFSRMENYDKLYSKDYEHYKDTPIDIPPDHRPQVVERWNSQIEELEQQKERLQQQGDTGKASQIQEKIDRIEDTKGRLRESKVSNEEAIEARLKPTWSTIEDIHGVSHQAGLEAVKYGAAIGGGVSTVQNLAAVANGEKDLDEAMLAIAKDTGKSAVIGYGTGYVTSALGGALQSSKNMLVQNLGKGMGPMAILNAGRILATNITKLAKGELSGEEFAMSMTRESVALASSTYGAGVGAAIGSAIFPGLGTVVGGVIGGMLSSVVVNSMFGQLQQVMAQTKVSNQQRQQIEQYCAKLMAQEQENRRNMEQIFDYFFDEKERAFVLGFNQINESLQRGEDITQGLETIANSMGLSLAFHSVEQFTAHRQSGKAFRLGG